MSLIILSVGLAADLPMANTDKRPGWADEKFTMGAIRWDAWYGSSETDNASKDFGGVCPRLVAKSSLRKSRNV